jgi:hypothetical protein
VTVSDTPGLIKHFYRVPWRFQETFVVPQKDLAGFVSTIFSTHEKLQSGRLIIDRFVFEPENLLAMLARYSLGPTDGAWSVEATGSAEVAKLLQAALTDSIDFAFVPTPKPFVIYVDHDEYATFYANTKSNLNIAVQALVKAGYKKVLGYERRL